MRTLVVDGKAYQYRIGHHSMVLVHPDGKKEIVRLAVIANRTPDTIDRGRWKKTSDGMITPKHVEGYIRYGGYPELTKEEQEAKDFAEFKQNLREEDWWRWE
jgi:hypothetical protein